MVATTASATRIITEGGNQAALELRGLLDATSATSEPLHGQMMAIYERALNRASTELFESPERAGRTPEEAKWALLERARDIVDGWAHGRGDVGDTLPPLSDSAPYQAAYRLIQTYTERHFVQSQPDSDANRFARGRFMALAEAAVIVTRFVRPPEAQEHVYRLVTSALMDGANQMRESDLNLGDPQDNRTEILFRAERLAHEIRTGTRISAGISLPALTEANAQYYEQAERVLRLTRTGYPDLRRPVSRAER